MNRSGLKWPRVALSSLLAGLMTAAGAAAGEPRSGRPATAPASAPASSGLASDPESFRRSPRIFRDRTGAAWSAWEEWAGDRSLVIVARGLGDTAAPLPPFPQPDGFNVLPALGFDLRNRPIVVWSNSDGIRTDVWVRDLEAGLSRRLDSLSESSAPAPCIATDADGRTWAFWNRPISGEVDGVAYRVFDGARWSALRIIATEPRFPASSPAAAADSSGGVWLGWSGWDGRRYSIWTSRHDGTAWSAPLNVSGDASDGNDLFPAFAVTADGVPVLAWNRSGERGSAILAAIRSGDRWTGGSPLPGTVEGASRPSLSVAGPDVEASWLSARGLVVRSLPVARLRQTPAKSEAPGTSGFSPPPARDDDMYTCFGDSITYGHYQDENAPSLGYVPRLQNLAREGFGRAACINAGRPGEYTWEGLDRIASALSSPPSGYVLIMEGTNDVIINEISMDTAAFNLREMAARCLQRGALPVLATIIPRRDWAWQTAFYRNRLLALNEKIRALAAALAVPLVDQFQAFTGYPDADGGLLSLLDDDLKHPGLKGYDFMARTWFAALRSLPFPPAGVSIRRRDVRLDPPSGPIRLTAAEGRMTIVSWSDNPKIGDPAGIRGYHVYRKRAAEPDSAFRRLALATGPRLFVDKTIVRAEIYVYAVSTVRTDGIEGAWSAPLADR